MPRRKDGLEQQIQFPTREGYAHAAPISRSSTKNLIRAVFTFTSKIHHDTYPEIAPAANPCTGKAVLVTGSNRGIGLATLLSYARAGASHLAVCSRTPAPSVPPQLRSAAVAAGHPEPEVLSLILDVTSQEQAAAAAKEVQEKWGRLDILVNNAGFMAPDTFEPLGKSGWAGWDRCMDVNLMGAVRVTRALLPVMLGGGDKTVVNLSTVGALYAEGGGEAYSLAKLTLCRLSEFLCYGYKDEVSFPGDALCKRIREHGFR